MAEDTDLLPWVLGAMLALGTVAAIAVGLPDPTPAGAPTAPHAAVSAGTLQAAPSAAHPAASTSPVPATKPQLPAGQVWECELNGQRVFSDVQCGTHATVRQLPQLNVFDPSAAYARDTPRPYGYAGGPGEHSPPMPANDAPPEDAEGGADDSIYSQVIVVHDRAWRLAHHRNHPHPRAGAHHP
jgi:hypothetical protein